MGRKYISLDEIAGRRGIENYSQLKERKEVLALSRYLDQEQETVF